MKWEDREDVIVRKEAIEVLMDGIHQNIDEDELDDFANAHNIPYSRQKPKSSTPAPAPYADSNYSTQTPFIGSNDDDDEDDEDEYDESDDYYVSS